MRIRAFITHLEAIAKEYGENLDCVYSTDDEGNGFNLVYYSPTIGYFDGEDFDTKETREIDSINAVCIN
jgi:uncharacterized protein YkuJ